MFSSLSCRSSKSFNHLPYFDYLSSRVLQGTVDGLVAVSSPFRVCLIGEGYLPEYSVCGADRWNMYHELELSDERRRCRN